MACIIEDNDPADIIFGCTDPSAINFNINATVDDSSCIYEGDKVIGCTDPLALNYDPHANWDNGKICVYEDCPNDITIRPTDGVVFYTEGTGGVIIVDDGGLTNDQSSKGSGPTPPPTPISVPLTEGCCTLSVVGQPVVWDGEFCKVQINSDCPEPLSISIDGVVLSNVGTPVNETCCNTQSYAIWDPNYIIDGNKKPGACIVGELEQDTCDLSLLDVLLNNDGTVVTPIDVIPTPPTPVNDSDGSGIINNDSCVSVDTWFASNVTSVWSDGDINRPPGIGNGKLIRYNTTDVDALDLMVGQQIVMTGFDIVDPAATCYNLSAIPTLNGYTTILDIAYNPATGVITITTSIYISQYTASQSTCTGSGLFIDVSGSASVCPYYGDMGNTDTQTCVSMTSYRFNQLSTLYTTIGEGSSYGSACGETQNGDDYYLSVTSNDNGLLNLTNCEYYELGDNFQSSLDSSCWADEYIVTEEDENDPNIQIVVLQGELDTSFTSAQLLTTGTLTNGNGYLAIFKVSIPFQGGEELIISGCTVDEILVNSDVCDADGNLSGLTDLGNKGGPIKGDGGTPPNIPAPTFPDPQTELVNISETCCDKLGGDLWEFIDGVCYWNPPKDTVTVSIGVSENDIIVTDEACDTLTVCLSMFLEQPNSPDCYDPTSDITANIGVYSAYSGGIETNLFNLTPGTTYSSLSDGYCTWVQVCGTIENYDGTPFRVKLNLEGVLDCCEYDIFVDDISVSCTIQDSIEVSTKNDCPGFTLHKVIDNKKSWVYNEGVSTNRVFAPSSDADIPWRYTNYVEQSGVYENHSNLVLNSKELNLTFNMCTPENCDTTMNVFQLIEYKNNFQNFWVKFVEQFVPSTTIFISGEKWCNKPDEICTVMDDCDYDNSFDLTDLGIKKISSPGTGNGDGSGNRLPINDTNNTVINTDSGDYGDNTTEGPIIFDGFISNPIKYNPSTTEEELTFPDGYVPLLEDGVKVYLSKMSTPVSKLVK